MGTLTPRLPQRPAAGSHAHPRRLGFPMRPSTGLQQQGHAPRPALLTKGRHCRTVFWGVWVWGFFASVMHEVSESNPGGSGFLLPEVAHHADVRDVPWTDAPASVHFPAGPSAGTAGRKGVVGRTQFCKTSTKSLVSLGPLTL